MPARSRLLTAEDDRSERKLLHAGATRVVSPYAIGGHRMAHALLRPTVLMGQRGSLHDVEQRLQATAPMARGLLR